MLPRSLDRQGQPGAGPGLPWPGPGTPRSGASPRQTGPAVLDRSPDDPMLAAETNANPHPVSAGQEPKRGPPGALGSTGQEPEQGPPAALGSVGQEPEWGPPAAPGSAVQGPEHGPPVALGSAGPEPEWGPPGAPGSVVPAGRPSSESSTGEPSFQPGGASERATMSREACGACVLWKRVRLQVRAPPAPRGQGAAPGGHAGPAGSSPCKGSRESLKLGMKEMAPSFTTTPGSLPSVPTLASSGWAS